MPIGSKALGETGAVEGVGDGVGCKAACTLLAICEAPLAGRAGLNCLEAGDGGLHGFVLVLLEVFLGDLFDDAISFDIR